MERHGDAKLTDLLVEIVACPRRALPASTTAAVPRFDQLAL
jgi:hypothetical protein